MSFSDCFTFLRDLPSSAVCGSFNTRMISKNGACAGLRSRVAPARYGDDFDTWKEFKCVLLAFAQVIAQLPGATEARRSPSAVVFASGLAWAAVTFSANAADLSAGMSLCWPESVGTLFVCN